MDTTNHITTPPRHVDEHHWADSTWFRWLLISAIGLGIFFRLAGLGNKIYSHDEAYTSLYAAGYRGGFAFTSLWDGTDKTVDDIQKFITPVDDKSIADTYFVLARFEPHESPLFFLAAHTWMRIVGHTPSAMRGLAALFSLLSIAPLYWLGRELFTSSRTALLAAALFALSPYQVLFAQDARPYSLWTLATLVSSAALLQAMRKNTRNAWLLYSVTLIFGIYSHQLFALVAIVHVLTFAGKQTLRSHRTLGGFLSAAMLALLAFSPWLFSIITRWEQAAVRMEWVNIRFPWYRYIQRWMLNFSSPFVDLDFGSANLLPYVLRTILLLLLALAWIFLLRHGSIQQKKFLLLLFTVPAAFFILPDMLLGGIRSIGGRYYVPVSIAAVLVMAYFLSHMMDRAKSGTRSRWEILIILLLTAGVGSNMNSLFAETWWNKELGRIRPEFLREINRDRTVLVVSGYRDTNLGDILSLGFEADPSVHFRLYEDPADVQPPDNYQHIYWLPASQQEIEGTSAWEGFQVSEVISGVLWQITGSEK